CCCSAAGAFISEADWPNASAAPKPAIVWKVVAPLIVAVSAAYAGADGSSVIAATAPSTLRLAASGTPRRRPTCLVSVGTVRFLRVGSADRADRQCRGEK